MRMAIAVAAAVAAVVTSGAAQVAETGSNGRMTISGGSTLRDWTCEVTDFRTTLRTEPGVGPAVAELPEGRQRLSVVIPVRSIDCRNGTMNDHLRDALKAGDHPQIRYELGDYEIRDGVVRATGALTVAGRTVPVTMDVQVTPHGGGVRVQGQHALRMTDLGVRPPRLMLGTLKVDDEITVGFDVLIGHSALALATTAAGR